MIVAIIEYFILVFAFVRLKNWKKEVQVQVQWCHQVYKVFLESQPIPAVHLGKARALS